MTRPKLADITQRAERRATAAEVRALVRTIQAVLEVADGFERLASRHPESETGQVEAAVANEIRCAVIVRIDTTPKEAP